MSSRYVLLAETGLEFFTTRARASQIRTAIEQMPDAAAGVVLDFEGVEAITGQFADELVCGLVAGGFLLRVDGANENLRDTLEIALNRRGLSTAVISGE